MQSTTKLVVRKMGGSIGLVIPREIGHRMKLSVGDYVHFTESSGGGWRLTRHDPDFERQMALAYQIMANDANVLKELAK